MKYHMLFQEWPTGDGIDMPVSGVFLDAEDEANAQDKLQRLNGPVYIISTSKVAE